ncbi:hypothetical protein ACJMK2_032937 [Sinanodonta woodiana]|uniref:Uncharacterized protein n=1 Tax=Sinanodonta woodiana TaxID=1069815 RepID=A0ABD3X3B4_SINWO
MEPGLTNWVDILILVLYFVFVMAIGLWASCRKGSETVKGYFLAGRDMVWLPIGFSLFASNIGSEHFVGLAGSGASSGIAVVAFEWGAVMLLLLLGWVFLPIYLISGAYTIPEYMSQRFGGNRLRIYLSVVSLILYTLTKISVDVYAGAVFIQQALGWNTYIAIAGLLVVTAVYTIVDCRQLCSRNIQTVIMVVGATVTCCSWLGIMEYKYMNAIPSNYTTNSNSTCGHPRADAFHILPLSAKNIGHAKGATIVAGYLKLLPLFIIVIPGMISRVLYTDEVACIDPEVCKSVCDNANGCSNIAYPKLVLGLAPTGLRGLMIAVMMAALMSSLTSIFNSAATLFSLDIWKKLRNKASEKELLLTGRIFVVILVGISVAWIPLIKLSQGAQLFIYIQAVTGYIVPPICIVFLLTVFVPRVNEQGAFWAIVLGQIVGVVRLVLDLIYQSPRCGEVDIRPDVLVKVNFTYFAGLLLVLSGIICIVVSMCTQKLPSWMTSGLTFWSVQAMSINNKKRVRRQQIKNRLTSISLTIFDASKIKRREEIEARNLKNKEKLNVSQFWNWFLNINAILVLCIFVMCFAIFA